MRTASPWCSLAFATSSIRAMPKLQKLVIATRESALALWQANFVADQLRLAYPELDVSLLAMTTKGDQILDRPLSAIGGKGLFLKELEIAMLEGRADCAVHSLKDVPMQLEPEFTLAAVMQRASPFDALIAAHGKRFFQLPHGARVGSSSLRRQVQLHALRPDLRLMDLRGNVNTRLKKLAQGDFDAIVLAEAGLDRLGFAAQISETLIAPEFLPAAGQGALALECLQHRLDVQALLRGLAHRETWTCVRAERSLAQALGGSCQMPIAAYATLHEDTLRLQALLGDGPARRHVRAELSATARDPEALGAALAGELQRLAQAAKF
jgi:hydroxymethylbilane synthase